MRIINLSSGSDGNITYIETENLKILLDDGLSAQKTVEKLKQISIAPSDINAIILSHEHSDHTKGVDVFATKFNIPVYAHENVWLGLDEKLKQVPLKNRKLFENQFVLNDLLITPFEVPHDVSCYGFTFQKENKKIAFATDLGHFNDKIIANLMQSRIVYIESNYDRDLLFKGTKYPLSLKRRIDGPNGHLENIDSADAIERLAIGGTRQFVLAHLSKENNTPTIAYSTACNYLQKDGIQEGRDIKIDVATTEIGTMFKLK